MKIFLFAFNFLYPGFLMAATKLTPNDLRKISGDVVSKAKDGGDFLKHCRSMMENAAREGLYGFETSTHVPVLGKYWDEVIAAIEILRAEGFGVVVLTPSSVPDPFINENKRRYLIQEGQNYVTFKIAVSWKVLQ